MSTPIIAQKSPYAVNVEAGKTYAWCACGGSKSQPFCDGSHAGTALGPVEYKAPATRTAYFCGCRATGNKPLCDGSHKNL